MSRTVKNLNLTGRAASTAKRELREQLEAGREARARQRAENNRMRDEIIDCAGLAFWKDWIESAPDADAEFNAALLAEYNRIMNNMADHGEAIRAAKFATQL